MGGEDGPAKESGWSWMGLQEREGREVQIESTRFVSVKAREKWASLRRGRRDLTVSARLLRRDSRQGARGRTVVDQSGVDSNLAAFGELQGISGIRTESGDEP